MIRALALLCALLGCGEPGPTPPERGIALGLFASTPTWDYGPLIAEIAHHGATEVLVVVPLRQATVHSDRLTAVVPEATLRQTLAQARSAGLRVSLMPIIELEHRRRPRRAPPGRAAPGRPRGQPQRGHRRRLRLELVRPRWRRRPELHPPGQAGRRRPAAHVRRLGARPPLSRSARGAGMRRHRPGVHRARPSITMSASTSH